MEGDDGPEGNWVVKPQVLLSSSDARRAYFVLSELAAAEVCTWVSVPTPAIGLTRFPEKLDKRALLASLASLDNATEREEVVELFALNRGKLAFCSLHLQGGLDVLPGTFRKRSRKDALRRTGASIYFLDAFFRNDDRQVGNANLLWMYDELVAIDHGHAFVGVNHAGTTGATLAGRTVLHSAQGFQSHVLRADLARLPNAAALVEEAAKRLEAVADAAVEGLLASWPEELDSGIDGEPPRVRILEFLRARRKHCREVAKNLTGLVSESR